MSPRRRSRYGYRGRRARALRRLMMLGATALAGFGGLVLWAALGAPPSLVVTRTLRVDEPPDVIWQVLVDLDNLPTWRRGVARVERLPDRAAGPAWIEYHGGRPRVLQVRAAVPARRLVTERLDVNGAGGSWSWELTGDSRGSLLTVAHRVTPAGRLARASVRLLRQPAREMDGLLEDLQRRLDRASRLRATALNR